MLENDNLIVFNAAYGHNSEIKITILIKFVLRHDSTYLSEFVQDNVTDYFPLDVIQE